MSATNAGRGQTVRMPDDPRDVIRRNDPDRAARAEAVDPTPLPCACTDPRTIEVQTMSEREPRHLCTTCDRWVR